MAERGGLIGAIRALSRPGHGLLSLPSRREPLLGRFLSGARVFDPSYRSSAQARLGGTSRHLTIGGAAAVGGLMLWHHFCRGRLKGGRTRH
ncbi:hypothetical protein [Paracoccus sp. (in: a-proteobacteria)]|uniref:hypothetical protein n=1 Tax=Paracoccus sp. TaxID=267 RepID=UPI0028AD5DA8|nr:hypothetical protein [Paracoccus sp. (in: a-proteobacteria)]